MWWGTVNRSTNANFSQPPLNSGDDQFLITVNHPPSSNDRWIFNPSITSVKDRSYPVEFSLSQNFPNPFNPSTTIQYTLQRQEFVRLRIYNLLGQEVATLLEQAQNAGEHTILWNGTNSEGKIVTSGVYFYRLETGTFARTKKMLLLR
jgi:hypothetical protein